MAHITRQQAVDLINRSNGQFINVCFVKRTTGELRSLTGRTGVVKYVNGQGLKYDRIEKALLGIWEANAAEGKDAYRSIPVEGIVSVTANGQLYEIGD